jgi:hypothetical protein
LTGLNWGRTVGKWNVETLVKMPFVNKFSLRLTFYATEANLRFF